MRAIGFEAIRTALPSWAIEALSVATHLGDYEVVVAIAVVGAVVLEDIDADRIGMVVVALGAIGLATVAKATFGLPRPPGAGVGGYGFPSGHALGSTVVYGLIATRIGTRRAAIGAAAIVATIGLSRVAIGVHYPADVAMGMGLGLAFLAITLAALEHHPGEVSSERVAPGGTQE